MQIQTPVIKKRVLRNLEERIHDGSFLLLIAAAFVLAVSA